MSSKRLQQQHGSTLVESLIALGVFGLATAAIGNLLTQQIRMQGTNGTTTTAITLVSKELEDLRAMDYGILASRTSTTTIKNILYTVATNVVTDSPAVGMKSITTAVSWTEAVGPKSYTAYAIYTDVTR